MSLRNWYLTPKLGSEFRVIIVVRISTENQDVLSLVDQEAYNRRWLDQNLCGPYQATIIASRGSGENLERAEFLELTELVASGQYDLVIAEDLGRICRRIQAHIFCEEAEDCRTRVVAINDHIDTGNEGWQQAAIFASFRHESYNRDTASRIRRTLQNRFMDGRVVMTLPFGYIKPHAHATDQEVTKDPLVESVYDEWFSRLESGQNYREVADWLNAQKVPTGDYCRTDEWTGPMVKRVTFNPILKGVRQRNNRITQRVNRTGRSRSVRAPESELLERRVPHLAFIDEERYDRTIRLLTARNAKYRRSESERNDPRANVPRSQTRWPGQHLRCGVCGRLFVFGGHGRKERLMCSGVRDYICWNATTVSGPEVVAGVANQLRQFYENLPEFDLDWREEYDRQRSHLQSVGNEELQRLQESLNSETRRLENLFDVLHRIGSSSATADRIRQCEMTIATIRDNIRQLESRRQCLPDLPSVEEIQGIASSAFAGLADDSPEFGRIMRRVVDEFYVLPYRLADGGHVQPKVCFRASLFGIVEDGSAAELPIQQVSGVVDLTTTPRRVAIMDEIAELEAQALTQDQIAKRLGVFQTEVWKAKKLQTRMGDLGITCPWIPMTSVEMVRDYFPRLRNSRFEFQPLPEFDRTRHPG